MAGASVKGGPGGQNSAWGLEGSKHCNLREAGKSSSDLIGSVCSELHKIHKAGGGGF